MGPLGRQRVLAAMLGFGMALAIPTGGCSDGVFACVDDSDCMGGGSGGTCEPSGYCSFDDPACPGGRRYGEHSAENLAGDCIGGTSGVTTLGTSVTVTEASTMAGTSESSSTGGASEATTAPGFDAYGPCNESSECEIEDAACVTNGPNRMCAPGCTIAEAPSDECPVAVDGVSEVGCLYTDAEMTEVRCFVLCDATTPCPAGMLCVEPVCTWSGA